MKKRTKIFICGLLALAMLVPMAVSAVPALALEKQCSITVRPGKGEAEELLAESTAVTDLYLIASSPSQGVYQFEKDGLGIPEGDTGWKDVAQKAALEYVGAEAPDITGVTFGETVSGVDAGLYLLVTHDPDVAAGACLETIEDDAGSTLLASKVHLKTHTATFLPEIVAVPGKPIDEATGAANTADPSDWEYDVTAWLKPELVNALGSIEIVKDLLSFEEKHDAFFLFQCEGYLDGEHVYSNLVSIRFDNYGEKRVLLENIPVGTDVTVTEVYSTPGYSIVGSDNGTITVSADEILSVRFENDYDNNRDHGGGIMNNFDYDLERGEWSWTAD